MWCAPVEGGGGDKQGGKTFELGSAQARSWRTASSGFNIQSKIPLGAWLASACQVREDDVITSEAASFGRLANF